MKHTDLFAIEPLANKPATVGITYIGPKPTNDQEAAAISVAKWETVADLHREGVVIVRGAFYTDTCGFCMLYVKRGCQGCPVITLGSGGLLCTNTPFTHYDVLKGAETSAEQANDERNFLVEIAQRLEEQNDFPSH